MSDRVADPQRSAAIRMFLARACRGTVPISWDAREELRELSAT